MWARMLGSVDGISQRLKKPNTLFRGISSSLALTYCCAKYFDFFAISLFSSPTLILRGGESTAALSYRVASSHV